jgi:hypothetical protein
VTKQDFIINTLTSMLGAILYDLSRKGLVYVRSKKFRKARKRVARAAYVEINNARTMFFPIWESHRYALSIAFLILMLISLFVWHAIRPRPYEMVALSSDRSSYVVLDFSSSVTR